MMVNPYVDAIFLGHVKSGSRVTYPSLEAHGFRLVGKRHWNMRDLRKIAAQREVPKVAAVFPRNLGWWNGIDGWNRRWRYICTIRNPYSMVLSLWCWREFGGKREVTRRVSREFIAGLHEMMPQYFPEPGRLWRFLYDPGCEFVLRWETLTDDLERVFGVLGIPGPLNPRFFRQDESTVTTNKPRGDPREWWTEEALDWFAEAYGDELERTGYG